MTSATQYEIPNISVDVVPVYLNGQTSQVNVVLGKRQFEPYLGDFALPGVLLTPQERLDEAAKRALVTKTRVPAQVNFSLFDMGTFDNPDRDPRGATVSIAKIAVLPAHYFGAEDVEGTVGSVPIDIVADPEIQKLPFDHNNIIRHAAEMISEKLLHSKEFTRALLGEVFTTSNIRGIVQQLELIIPSTDLQVDFSNLGRVLKKSGWVVQDEQTQPSGRGRPSRTWTWL